MTFSKRVESWRDDILALPPAFPVEFLLASIQIESDGEFPHRSRKSETFDRPRNDERGPMEVSWAEASEILDQSPADFARYNTSRDYSLRSGQTLFKYYHDTWLPQHVQWSNPLDRMRATKATHAGGMGFMKSLIHSANEFYGRPVANWQEVKAMAKIALANGTYKNSAGETKKLASSVISLGPRVIAQIDKLDRLMGTTIPFSDSANSPVSSVRLPGGTGKIGVAAGVIGVIGAIVLFNSKRKR